MNALTTVSAADLAKLAEELGAARVEQRGVRIPVLRINRVVEDNDGNLLPRGEIYLDNEIPVYAKSVTFRPLSHHFQYSKFDSASRKYTCWSRQISDWGDEPRDTNGTLRCGKPDSKAMRQMDREERGKYKDVKLTRLVRGIVSYTGTTQSGEEVTVENQPCLLKLTGQNNFQSGADKPYAPFEEQFKKRIPAGYDMWNFDLTLTSKRHRNDAGDIVWYTFEYAFDPTSPQPMTDDIYQSVIHIAKLVREENQKVDEAYMKAIKGDFEYADVYEQLGDDLDDDLEDVA